MNLAAVASDTVWKDSEANLEQTERHVAEVMRRWPKTEVILFPEISLAGFITDPSNKDVAETLNGSSVQEVKRIAKQYNVALICSFVEQNENPEEKPYNSTFVISADGELKAVFHKNHLFTGSAEPEVFSPGKELVTFELNGWKCGIATCFDNRFPRLFETYKKAGVELVFMPCNWVHGRNKPAILENIVKARAHENQFFVAAVDRSGSDPNTSYYGISVISNPYCEDTAERDGVYSYAELDKDDIAAIAKMLPLAESFKSEYLLKEY